MVTCFRCNGVVLCTEEILPNFGAGGSPDIVGLATSFLLQWSSLLY